MNWVKNDAKFGHFTVDLFIKPCYYILLSYVEPIILLKAEETALYYYLASLNYSYSNTNVLLFVCF
jgi:hypothetical protein